MSKGIPSQLKENPTRDEEQREREVIASCL